MQALCRNACWAEGQLPCLACPQLRGSNGLEVARRNSSEWSAAFVPIRVQRGAFKGLYSCRLEGVNGHPLRNNVVILVGSNKIIDHLTQLSFPSGRLSRRHGEDRSSDCLGHGLLRDGLLLRRGCWHAFPHIMGWRADLRNWLKLCTRSGAGVLANKLCSVKSDRNVLYKVSVSHVGIGCGITKNEPDQPLEVGRRREAHGFFQASLDHRRGAAFRRR